MKTISELHNKYKNTDKVCVILGCGQSAASFKPHPKIHTIGVNDIGLIHNPDTLLLVDERIKFKNDWKDRGEQRICDIEKTISEHYIIMDKNWRFPSEKTYFFKLGQMNQISANLDGNEKLNYGSDSPYMAANLAYKMGFRTIAFLGVDYTPNHFYSTDGDHQLIKLNLENRIQQQYSLLMTRLSDVKLFNLSEKSIIRALPKLSFDDFVIKTLVF